MVKMEVDTPKKKSKSPAMNGQGSPKKLKHLHKTPNKALNESVGANFNPQNSGSVKKGKKPLGVDTETPKKIKMFEGTSALNKNENTPKNKQKRKLSESSDTNDITPNKKNKKANLQVRSPAPTKESGASPKVQAKQDTNKNKLQENEASKAGEKKRRKKRTITRKIKVENFKAELQKTSDKSGLIKELEKKIAAITSRGEVTKTGKRKIKFFNKLKIVAEGGDPFTETEKAEKYVTESAKRRLRRKSTHKLQKMVEDLENKHQEERKAGKKVKAKEDSDDDVEGDQEDNSDEDQTAADVGSAEEEAEGSDEEANDGSDDEDNEASDDEDNEASDEEDNEVSAEEDNDASEEEKDDASDDEEEDEEPVQKKVKQQPKFTKSLVADNKQKSNQQQGGDKKTRYVLYVCNLPFDSNENEIKDHFKKAGEITSVRIPKNKEGKPRGFAYVEVNNEEAYQKVLSMHETFIKGRQIKVEYTKAGGKNSEDVKKDIRTKNAKLHAMRKEGKLAGSVKENQKRSFRRKNQRGGGDN